VPKGFHALYGEMAIKERKKERKKREGSEMFEESRH